MLKRNKHLKHKKIYNNMKKGFELIFPLFLLLILAPLVAGADSYAYCGDDEGIPINKEVKGTIELSILFADPSPEEIDETYEDSCFDKLSGEFVDSCSGGNCVLVDYACATYPGYYHYTFVNVNCSNEGYLGCYQGGCVSEPGTLSFERADVDPGDQTWTQTEDLPVYLNVMEIAVSAIDEDVSLDKIEVEIYPWSDEGRIPAEFGWPNNKIAPYGALLLLINDKNKNGNSGTEGVEDVSFFPFPDGDTWIDVPRDWFQEVESTELPMTMVMDGPTISKGETVYLSFTFIMGGREDDHDYFVGLPTNQYTIKLKSIEATSLGLSAPVTGDYFTNTLTMIPLGTGENVSLPPATNTTIPPSNKKSPFDENYSNLTIYGTNESNQKNLSAKNLFSPPNIYWVIPLIVIITVVITLLIFKTFLMKSLEKIKKSKIKKK